MNPLGPRLLPFPLTLGEKQEAFKNIVEWRSPDFSRGGGYFALAFLGLALVLLDAGAAELARRGAGRWPSCGQLLAARNIGPLAVVLAPVLGRAVRRPESAPSRTAAASRRPSLRMNRALLATLLAAFVLFGTLIFAPDPLDTVGYPVESMT